MPETPPGDAQKKRAVTLRWSVPFRVTPGAPFSDWPSVLDVHCLMTARARPARGAGTVRSETAGILVNDEEFGRTVKGAVTRAYDEYLGKLKKDQALSDEELVALTQNAVADIFRAIDGLPGASRVRASKLAIAISVRTGLQLFNAAQRAEFEAAKRRRFSNN
jgi:hypothetical protein